jgi:ankyrin repeat protein
MDHAIRLGALVPPCAARPTQPICAVKTVTRPYRFIRNEGGLAMTTEVVVENTMTWVRRVLLAWVALSIGCASAALAGPVEDLLNAASRGDMAAVQALLNAGTDVNGRTSERCRDDNPSPLCDGATALILASFTGHLQVVQALLDQGADVNSKMYGGATALGMAFLAGTPFSLAVAPDSCRPPNCLVVNIVQVLLDKGADVNADEGGMTALGMAFASGHLEVVQVLLDRGAEVNEKASFDPTVLMRASASGRLDMVRALLGKGAEVNAKTLAGETALMAASGSGFLDIVRALLDKAADVNAKTANFRTALMSASQGGHLDIVQALIENGADVNFKTYYGMTALTVARNAEVKALLMRAGAKP